MSVKACLSCLGLEILKWWNCFIYKYHILSLYLKWCIFDIKTKFSSCSIIRNLYVFKTIWISCFECAYIHFKYGTISTCHDEYSLESRFIKYWITHLCLSHGINNCYILQDDLTISAACIQNVISAVSIHDLQLRRDTVWYGVSMPAVRHSYY